MSKSNDVDTQDIFSYHWLWIFALQKVATLRLFING